jgi:hypothetical protein
MLPGMGNEQIPFVVWLDRGSLESGEISGQVEHVPTSRRQRFGSREELIRFLATNRVRGDAKPRPAPRARP